MRSPIHGLDPPYRLRSNIVYFHDWRHVQPGGYGWLGPDGEKIKMMGPGPVPEMHYVYCDIPLGISLRAMPAQKTEPVLSAASTGDCSLFNGSLISEDGIYRLWYESWLDEHFKEGTAGSSNALRYAESADGIHWKQPKVAPEKYRKDKKNRNIVYGGELTPTTGFHGGCVFKDPDAPKGERYKSFHLGSIDTRRLAAYRKKRPHDIDPMVEKYLETRKKAHGALYGAVSPDGIRWKAIRNPVLVQMSDTHNICEYDPVLGKYVAYIRTWVARRRTIGRTISDDFRHFEFPEEVFWPDAMQKPYNTWYANGKTTMPRASDYHIMFPMRWDLTTDRFSFHLAVSPDNVIWSHVPGGAVCEPGDRNGWDAGVVAPGHGMVELPGDRIGILFTGTPVPHKYPRQPPFGAAAWAYWTKGRLVALQAPEEGSFALHPLLFDGRKVLLNVRTAMTGYVQVEAVGVDGNTLPGRTFDDCDCISGDHIDRLVTWHGESDLGHQDGTEVTLRIRLRNAELFSVEFSV